MSNLTAHKARPSFNIIVFGEAGVGKSSVINLIAGEKVAETSPDSWGCTLESKQYTFKVETETFNIWDTVGLGEPTFSAESYLSVVEKTYALIQQIMSEGGLDLLLFCIPGSGTRITQTMLSNYKLFYEVLCEERIPIALVVTRLENEARMEDWWIRNSAYLDQCMLKFSGHACVTGLPAHPKVAEGQAALALLLLGFNEQGRYAMPPASDWYVSFLRRLPALSLPNMKRTKRKQLEQLLRNHCVHTEVARELALILTNAQSTSWNPLF